MSDTAENATGDRWVVGVDGSDPANHALDWVIRHCEGRADPLDLVAAWEASLALPRPSDDDPEAGAGQPARVAADAAVAAAAERIGARDRVVVERHVVHGGTSAVLLDAAEGADLLVVGNRGHGGFRRLVLGSTSMQCVTHAEVPTLVVRGAPPAGPERVLVAVDGSANSQAAANWAVGFAAPGSTITLASVWDPSLLAVTAGDVISLNTAEAAGAAFHDWVAEVAARLHAHPATAGVDIAGDFSMAPPRTRLKELSDDSTLFVAGARGHGPVGSRILGSVSTWLLHHVDVPMVVVPTP